MTTICISSGHGKKVSGAAGIVDEVTEARRVVDQLAIDLEKRGVEVMTFHDDTSDSQSENLTTIVDWHNSHERDLDCSIHFNAYEQVDHGMGTECLYVTQSALASEIAAAIAQSGLINRGAKKRTDLKFLNSTEMPSVLVEVCFVDSETDCDIYEDQFEAICASIADVLGGALDPLSGVGPDQLRFTPSASVQDLVDRTTPESIPTKGSPSSMTSRLRRISSCLTIRTGKAWDSRDGSTRSCTTSHVVGTMTARRRKL